MYLRWIIVPSPKTPEQGYRLQPVGMPHLRHLYLNCFSLILLFAFRTIEEGVSCVCCMASLQYFWVFLGHLFDISQFSLDDPGAGPDQVVQVCICIGKLLLGLLNQVTKFAKLGLYFSQYLPDLAAALLDRKGLKAHLQAVQHRGQGGRPCNNYLKLFLEL